MSKIGKILKEEIIKTNEIRENIKINEYVIMPNHVHMIVEIYKKGTVPRAPTVEGFGRPTEKTIPTVIRYLKGSVTRRIYQEYGINKRIWQRNYYEHVIRNQRELFEIIEYIENNPINWNSDELNK